MDEEEFLLFLLLVFGVCKSFFNFIGDFVFIFWGRVLFVLFFKFLEILLGIVIRRVYSCLLIVNGGILKVWI